MILTTPSFFTLTVSPVASGKADDTVKQLQEQLDELSEIADNINLEHDKESYSLVGECPTGQLMRRR